MKRRGALLVASAVLALAVAAAVTVRAALAAEAALEDFAAFDGEESGSAGPLGAAIEEPRRNR